MNGVIGGNPLQKKSSKLEDSLLYTAPEEVHKYRKGNRLEFGGNIRFPEDRTRKGTQKRRAFWGQEGYGIQMRRRRLGEPC